MSDEQQISTLLLISAALFVFFGDSMNVVLVLVATSQAWLMTGNVVRAIKANK